MVGKNSEDILSIGKEARFESLARFSEVFGQSPRRLNEPRLIYLLVFIRQGEGNCYVDNANVPLKAGSFLLVNPYSFLHLAQTEYLLGHVILFTEDFFSRTYIEENLLYKVTYEPGRKALFQLQQNNAPFDFIKASFATLGLEYRTGVESELKTRLLHTILYSSMLYLHKLQLEDAGVAYDISEQLNKSKVVEFIQLLNQYFKVENSVSFYADKMYLSVKSFTEVCKRGIGWAPKAIIQSKLLTEAKRLLIFDPRPISDISMELGFLDQAAFSRFFTEYAGVSPKEFRENNKIKGFPTEN
jgi:AraC family transcriptional regulator, transcriptional activator of pobA